MAKKPKDKKTELKQNADVMCGEPVLVPIEDLKPYPANANTHPEKQVALLANAIAKQGWRKPIVVSNQSGYIVEGHGRLLAAKFLGLKMVPVDYQDFADESLERAHRLADNILQDLSELDMQLVKDEIVDINDGQFDLLLTGYDLHGIENIMTQTFVPESETEDLANNKKCPHCGGVL